MSTNWSKTTAFWTIVRQYLAGSASGIRGWLIKEREREPEQTGILGYLDTVSKCVSSEHSSTSRTATVIRAQQKSLEFGGSHWKVSCNNPLLSWVAETASHSRSLGSCLLAGCRRYHGAKLTEDFLFLLMVPEFIGWSQSIIQIHFRKHFLQISEAPICSFPRRLQVRSGVYCPPVCEPQCGKLCCGLRQSQTGSVARCQKEAKYTVIELAGWKQDEQTWKRYNIWH